VIQDSQDEEAGNNMKHVAEDDKKEVLNETEKIDGDNKEADDADKITYTPPKYADFVDEKRVIAGSVLGKCFWK
jgi:hypothetical protein